MGKRLSRIDHNDAFIDSCALNVPKKAERSVNQLALYLVLRATSDRERARAIFRWITHNITYNTKGLISGNYGDTTPGVLSRRTSICDGYARLFSALAQAARLKDVNISGYSKGYNYKIGSTFSGPPDHAWNAVQINGHWKLIDSTWGAGYVDEKMNYTRQLNDHYFLTPADQFIYGHFPEDTKWQLLDMPITQKEFERLPHLKPDFFRNKMAIGSHRYGVIETDKEIVITFRVNADVSLLPRIMRTDQKSTGSTATIQEYGARYEIHVTLPDPGEYLLRVYAKRATAKGAYQWVCDYKILSGVRDGGRTVSGRSRMKKPWWKF